MSAAVSQMEINVQPSGNSKQKSSAMLQSMNDVGESMAYMGSIDDVSENGYGTINSNSETLNKNNSYMDDYLMVCDTKPSSYSNLGSNTNMTSSENTNATSEVVMEGWILRKRSLQV